MFSPAAPRVELPAITLSSRLRLARASSSTGWRAVSAERRPSTTDWVWVSRSRSSAACGLLGLAARLEPAAQLGDVPDLPVGAPDQAPDQGGHDADAARTHTRRRANKSSSSDILGIVVREVGINKPVNLSSMARHPNPFPRAEPGA